MPSPLSVYSENMDWLRKEFNLSKTESLYEIVNKLVDEYKKLKQNQSKEIEDDTEKRVGRKKSSGS